MHFIYGLPVCPPICPPLGNDQFISSSEENLPRNNKYFNSYNKQINHHLISSSKENFYDEEFDQISLSDNYYVSFIKSRKSFAC
jgi:hypothetical protein